MVQDGLGTPSGLSAMEQVALALHLQHDGDFENVRIADDLAQALKYELETEPHVIDEFRRQKLESLRAHSESSWEERVETLASAPQELRKLLSPLNFPVWSKMLEELDSLPGGYEDKKIFGNLVNGFPLVGKLPAGKISAVPLPASEPVLPVADLFRQRETFNATVLRKVEKELPFAEDLTSIALDESTSGAMTRPKPVKKSRLSKKSYTRRLPVREKRGDLWRTRPVDHCTESGQNLATCPQEATENDGLDSLCYLLLGNLKRGRLPLMWKRDFSKAYRKIGIKPAHLPLANVIWKVAQKLMESQHRGMIMGSIAAVHGWHRTANVPMSYLRRILRVPACKYVDDFFGCSGKGIHFSGGRCLDILSELCGLPLDAKKSEDDKVSMVVIGARVCASQQSDDVAIAVSEDKAVAWGEDLRLIEETGVCEPHHAEKTAGRLSFSVSISANRVGRAYVRPFYAQAHSALPGGGISPWLTRSCGFFRGYLRACISNRICAREPKRHVNCWSDASGASRIVAFY